MAPDRLLLDTCAIIWLSHEEPVSESAVEAIENSRSLQVSPMSAWELGMLVAKGRLPATRPIDRWFDDFSTASGAEIAMATPAILIASSFLPPPVHNDPVDRILIATARQNDLTILTRDRKILQYAEIGHVRALTC